MSRSIDGFQWRSQSTFILVAAGATLSLNDFLTFPVLVGQNGGSAFLLLYLLFLAFMGLPLLMAELLLGRLGRSDPPRSFEILASQQKSSVYWKTTGFFSLLAAFLIVSTFSVIAGWSLSYFIKSGLGIYSGLTVDGVSRSFSEFILDTERMMLWYTLFILLLISVSAQQLSSGIQRFSLLLVPGMMLLLAIGFCGAIFLPGFEQSVEFLLHADFSRLGDDAPLLALQRAFYTLALGLGAMMVYGSYLPAKCSIGYSALLVIVIDLLFSISIGLSINALTFSAGIVPGLDSHYAYRILPAVFNRLDSGALFAALFFLMLVIAALTTSMALMEGQVSYLQRRFLFTRLKSVVLVGICIWIAGFGSVVSYSVWNGEGFTIALFFGDDAIRIVNNASIHDIMMFVSSRIMQPLAALFICLFVAWVIPRETSYAELGLSGKYSYEIWNLMIRYITPVLLMIVVLSSIGII
ncbi:MAG: sodium-dependent transporter [Gammaproteobacteria bacterium]|nr:sodium-dependent transporter [Gammaproteobacteria bacterium]